jgi:hypothetical protein
VRADRDPPGPASGWDEAGELLESGDGSSRLPRWAVAAAALLVALLVGVPRALDWQRDRRERAAIVAADKERRRLLAEQEAAERAERADRVDLVVVRLSPLVQRPPDDRSADPDTATIELTFTLANRGGAVRVHDVTFTLGGLPAVPLSHPDVIPEGGETDLTATIRARCADVLDLADTGESDLSASVTPASGRRQKTSSLLHHEPLPLASTLRDGCGLQSPWEAAVVSATFVPSSADRLTYVVGVRNISRRPLTVVRLSTPGMTVTASVRLPLVVAAGAQVKIRTTLRVARCDALDIPLRGGIDNFDPLVQLGVTGIGGASAELIASFAAEDLRYLEAKQQLLTKQCPRQARGTG